MEKRAYILTFGCQMNEYDSEVLESILSADGYLIANNPDNVDLAVVNTCSVRQKAESRAMSRIAGIAALKKSNPSMKLVVAGCMARRAGQAIIDDIPGVDYVVGSDYIPEISEIIGSSDRIFIEEKTGSAKQPYTIRPGRFVAYLAISRGCENFCSYCIVPYVRGSFRSRPVENIIAEMDYLVDQGIKDITLLGQNVNSYNYGGLDFPALLEKVAPHSPPRLRFLTSHPKDLSDNLIRCLAEVPILCQSLHLPLQVGSDIVLDRMNRGYTVEHYLRIIDKLRQAVPDITLTTDLIVGFPAESEHEFRQTLSAVEEIGFDSAFMFRYSARPGTAAAGLPDDVTEDEKISRLNRLISLQQKISADRNRRWLGRQVEVLIEKRSRRHPYLPQGKARGGQSVLITDAPDLKPGQLITARIETAQAKTLLGRFEKSL